MTETHLGQHLPAAGSEGGNALLGNVRRLIEMSQLALDTLELPLRCVFQPGTRAKGASVSEGGGRPASIASRSPFGRSTSFALEYASLVHPIRPEVLFPFGNPRIILCVPFGILCSIRGILLPTPLIICLVLIASSAMHARRVDVIQGTLAQATAFLLLKVAQVDNSVSGNGTRVVFLR